MTIRGFAWLADENISPVVVNFLREQGIDVIDAGELMPLGSADSEVLRLASEQRRVVLTHDRDFGTLAIRAGQPYVGIIFCRPGHIDTKFTIESLKTALNISLELTEPFILVVDRTAHEIRVRLRQPTN